MLRWLLPLLLLPHLVGSPPRARRHPHLERVAVLTLAEPAVLVPVVRR